MKEHPATPAVVKVETPVLNPEVYLLRKGNKAFVERKIDYPILKKDYSTLGFGAVAMLAIALQIGLVVVAAFNAKLYMLALLAVVGEIILAFIAYKLFQKWEANQRVASNGWIIPGAVLEAETVKIHAGKSVSEVVRIRYRFARPGGVVEEAFVEDSNTEANHIIAPQPNTPIYVWYKDDGTYYLL